jgi:hypothetical protein
MTSPNFDDNAEIRAMILLSLPYPPLPVRCYGLEDDCSSLGGEKSITTHDVLSKLLEETLQRGAKPQEHEQRKKRQQDVFLRFLTELCEKEGKNELPPSELYQLYCRYSIAHIETYFPEGVPPPPIGIANLDVVERGDPTHARMCDYMAGQGVLLKLEQQHAKDWKDAAYHQMLMEAKARLVFVHPEKESKELPGRIELPSQVETTTEA